MASGGSAIGWYATLLQQKAQEAVQKQPRLIGRRYRVGVRIWFEHPQGVTRVELRESTGDPKLDELLRSTLRSMSLPSEAPPQGVVQPMVLQVTAT